MTRITPKKRVMKMRTIKLKDGTVYDCDWCHGDQGILNINIISDQTIADLAVRFSNPDNTSVIIDHINDETENVYRNYTSLHSISRDKWRSGTILITLFESTT